MIILGIDPGYAIVGWGVIEYSGSRFRTLGYGSIQTPAGMPIVDRLEMIYRGMKELIEKYHPDEMAIEELFFTNNQKTGIVVAEARGIILLSARLSVRLWWLCCSMQERHARRRLGWLYSRCHIA